LISWLVGIVSSLNHSGVIHITFNIGMMCTFRNVIEISEKFDPVLAVLEVMVWRIGGQASIFDCFSDGKMIETLIAVVLEAH
jgi:hypothetical protein